MGEMVFLPIALVVIVIIALIIFLIVRPGGLIKTKIQEKA